MWCELARDGGNRNFAAIVIHTHFTRTHRTIFLVLWGIFAALTFAVTAMNVPHGPHDYGEVFWEAHQFTLEQKQWLSLIQEHRGEEPEH